ncbi:MAG: DUF503 family protein [Acidimicrobiales bacterium]
MFVGALRAGLLIPGAQSLKQKRSVVQSIVRTLDGWKGVAAAEVDYLELWGRTMIGVSVVGGSVSHVDDVLDSVDRFIWAQPAIEVIEIERSWLEND